ncbi:Hypothetical predicted protein, partial [Pelobates cultripes]
RRESTIPGHQPSQQQDRLPLIRLGGSRYPRSRRARRLHTPPRTSGAPGRTSGVKGPVIV